MDRKTVFRTLVLPLPDFKRILENKLKLSDCGWSQGDGSMTPIPVPLEPDESVREYEDKLCVWLTSRKSSRKTCETTRSKSAPTATRSQTCGGNAICRQEPRTHCIPDRRTATMTAMKPLVASVEIGTLADSTWIIPQGSEVALLFEREAAIGLPERATLLRIYETQVNGCRVGIDEARRPF